MGNSGNNESSWKTLLRDIFIVSIPLFILYKISTHPAINNIGYQDPNAPKKYSHEQLLQQQLFKLYITKEQEKKRKKHIFLQAIDRNNCHDFSPIDVDAEIRQHKKQQQKQNTWRAKKRRGRQASKNAVKVKRDHKLTKKVIKPNRPSALPAPKPIGSALWGDGDAANKSPNKGSETMKDSGEIVKKKKQKKVKKVKFGSRRPF